VQVQRTPSFVDGIGSPRVLPEMWPPASRLLAGSLVVSLPEVAAAIRQLAEHAAIVAEGAGGAAVAAGLKGLAGPGRYVAVVSGGNIDPEVLATILAGQIP
jgi:threonine dehydratase